MGSLSDLAKGVNKAMLIIVSSGASDVTTGYLTQSTEKILGAAGASAFDVSNAVGSVFDSVGLEQDGYKFIEVQYNPASITLRSAAPGAQLRDIPHGGLQNMVSSKQSVTNTILAVELTFDDMNIVDCFYTENRNAGLSTQTVLNQIDNYKTYHGAVHSVKDITNALVLASAKDACRQVIFKWSDMTFAGELTRMSAQYTMFSTSGRPVRSVVHLQITQKSNGNGYSVGDSYWVDDKIDDMFE